jgi:hypothetical protein
MASQGIRGSRLPDQYSCLKPVTRITHCKYEAIVQVRNPGLPLQLSDINNKKTIIMNVKRIFGALLTLLGVVGLIYAAVVFINASGNTRNIKMLVIFSILGIIFFIAGIGLIKTTKDEA